MNLKIEERLPIEYKGFLFRKSNNALILNSDDYNGAIQIMKKDSINNLEINSNFFKENHLDFLRKFDFIEGLTIISSIIKDISPIQILTNLKTLNIEHKLKGELDFQSFKNLQECSFVWGIRGSETIFDTLSLLKLRIDNYDKYEIIEISNLKKLHSLSLYYATIINLQGISRLKNLTKLDLTGCVYLEDIEKINELTSLRELRLDDCKNLTTLKPVNNLQKLQHLSFNNIGSLSSIVYLNSLSNLEEIFFSDNTNIKDGNLNNLEYLFQKAKLKKAIFKNRRHYTHKPQDLGFEVPDVVANIFRKK
ncbi:leucine-rich repeat protein [Aequorivita sp. KMM 9714]|uniref:leucine-rich repeat protein n=1 Tax=Aequorivita sp. KMM 9714 TaxID=2707173 RepID=UPI0013EDCF32|nr:leucine-rich repeat protein [Aequorivita sp. KMM 9714]NGX84410.1 leucine-rich repeat protein [Aequorivita sp. KMM 9714]